MPAGAATSIGTVLPVAGPRRAPRSRCRPPATPVAPGPGGVAGAEVEGRAGGGHGRGRRRGCPAATASGAAIPAGSGALEREPRLEACHACDQDLAARGGQAQEVARGVGRGRAAGVERVRGRAGGPGLATTRARPRARSRAAGCRSGPGSRRAGAAHRYRRPGPRPPSRSRGPSRRRRARGRPPPARSARRSPGRVRTSKSPTATAPARSSVSVESTSLRVSMRLAPRCSPPDGNHGVSVPGATASAEPPCRDHAVRLPGSHGAVGRSALEERRARPGGGQGEHGAVVRGLVPAPRVDDLAAFEQRELAVRAPDDVLRGERAAARDHVHEAVAAHPERAQPVRRRQAGGAEEVVVDAAATPLNGATIRLRNRLNHQSMPKNAQDVVLERPRQRGQHEPLGHPARGVRPAHRVAAAHLVRGPRLRLDGQRTLVAVGPTGVGVAAVEGSGSQNVPVAGPAGAGAGAPDRRARSRRTGRGTPAWASRPSPYASRGIRVHPGAGRPRARACPTGRG